jgi:hypothetical protein
MSLRLYLAQVVNVPQLSTQAALERLRLAEVPYVFRCGSHIAGPAFCHVSAQVCVDFL